VTHRQSEDGEKDKNLLVYRESNPGLSANTNDNCPNYCRYLLYDLHNEESEDMRSP
jgi:hypothetical protein